MSLDGSSHHQTAGHLRVRYGWPIDLDDLLPFYPTGSKWLLEADEAPYDTNSPGHLAMECDPVSMNWRERTRWKSGTGH